MPGTALRYGFLQQITADPPPEVNERLCSPARSPRSGCRRCIEYCPREAIAIDEGLRLNRSLCDGCGVCISACPNGVFRSPGREDERILWRIKECLQKGDDHTVRFQCSFCQAQGDGIILLSCLGRLTPTLLIAPFVYGAERVQLRKGLCQGCQWQKGIAHLPRVIRISRLLCRVAAIEEGRIEEVEEFSFSPHPSPLPQGARGLKEEILSRRAFFAAVKRGALYTTGQLLVEEKEGKGGSQEKSSNNPIRELLLHLLRQLPAASLAPVRPSGGPVRAEDLPFAQVRIRDGCIGCNVCAALCPVGAIKRKEEGNIVSLSIVNAQCTGCRLCAEVCGPQVIEIEELFDPRWLKEEREKELARVRLATCRSCGTSFWGGNSLLCLTCYRRGGSGPVPVEP